MYLDYSKWFKKKKSEDRVPGSGFGLWVKCDGTGRPIHRTRSKWPLNNPSSPTLTPPPPPPPPPPLPFLNCIQYRCFPLPLPFHPTPLDLPIYLHNLIPLHCHHSYLTPLYLSVVSHLWNSMTNGRRVCVIIVTRNGFHPIVVVVNF